MSSTRSSGSSSASRSHTKARGEIISMLKDDHKRAKSAFREFEKLDQQGDTEACKALAERTCAELEVHADLEEQLFYPAVREAIHDDDLMNEAEVEHMTFKVLIDRLKSMDAGDRSYAAAFTVLGEYVKHHVKEEEGEMFKQLTRKRVDWPELLADMNTRREELIAAKGLTEDHEEGASTNMASPGSQQQGMQQRDTSREAMEQLQQRGRSGRESPDARPRAASEPAQEDED